MTKSIPSNKKGFNKLPEAIQEKIDPALAAEYKKGGRVKKKKLDIKKAIKKPGSLRKSLGVKKGKKIPLKKLNKAAKAPGKLGQRARFAKTLSRLRKK
jgi:hypothetical protein